MKLLYSARDQVQAHEVRLFLESRGVTAEVLGDRNPVESGIYFSESSRPGVYVQASDWAEAVDLLEEYHATSTDTCEHREWSCPKCGEFVPWQFDECWKCSCPKPNDAQPLVGDINETAAEFYGADYATGAEFSLASANLPPLDPSSRYDTWLEVFAVLAFVWLPYALSGFEIWFYPDLTTPLSFGNEAVGTIIHSTSVSAVLLFIMYRSNLSWAAYGITRPRFALDIGLGLLVWLLIIFGDLMFLSLAGKFFGFAAVLEFTTSTYEFVPAQSFGDKLLLVPLCIAIAFSEELAMRSYLIPRFEQLFHSPWIAVLISTALFASYHIYQGFGAMLAISVSGLLLGTAFVLTRRLWPVVIAHTVVDVLAG